MRESISQHKLRVSTAGLVKKGKDLSLRKAAMRDGVRCGVFLALSLVVVMVFLPRVMHLLFALSRRPVDD